MNFGQVVDVLKNGMVARRKSWASGVSVVMMTGLQLPSFNTQATNRKVNDRTAKFIGDDTPLDSQPYFAQFDMTGHWQPGWLPSASDILAEDWEASPPMDPK